MDEFLTITAASGLIAEKQLSAMELTAACLDRARRRDDTLRAFILPTPKRAMAHAHAAEARVMAGLSRGPLDGIPIGHKDIYNTTSIRTTGHSRLLEHNVPGGDATAVQKWGEAGTLLMGKLSTHEFAIGGPSLDLPWPPARNAWNPEHFTAGSSSGTGAAVAAGFIFGSTGSDTGGSIRGPAALRAIAGIKPTYGWVNRAGALPPSFSMDHAGPMAWTVQDCALLRQAMAGYDTVDPTTSDRPVPAFTADIAKGVKGLRIGAERHFLKIDNPVSPAPLQGMNHALDVFEHLGADVRNVMLSPLADYRACGSIILTSEAYAIHEPWLKTRFNDYSDKQRLADRLMRRLRELWALGSALQTASGKHYPGEQLPRWALYAHWRKDGEPVWRVPELLAAADDTDCATANDTAQFCAALEERLQVDPSPIHSAYEDIHYHLWREHRLPANVLADDARLADPMDRARLARVLGHGLGAPVGSVLPLRRAVYDDVRIWQSGKWHFRGDAVFLLPGDSPIGYRLPLDGLPWVDPETIEHETEPDPFAPHAQLPPRQSFRAALPASDFMGAGAEDFRPVAQDAPVVDLGEPDVVRTALGIEPRDRVIHVFFPPLYAAEDWLALVAVVEDIAGELGRKVLLEGYLPPRDPDLLHFSVTPDPGVIEVDVHPASNRSEVVQRGEQLYEEAHQVGLATEKFMIDGRHVCTGAGNHVVMGAAELADSPFLRRPDLLKSLLGFWHNHPSLSYLFSGLFKGPSSQHPRIDEARQDSLVELEIAFSQIAPKQEVAPWLIDRMFRHLLADMTGNRHRTEFCIDKLYARETATDRLGLVEFRALEMPPHEHMAAAQLLLMRAAVAAFWQRPYERRLVHWAPVSTMNSCCRTTSRRISQMCWMNCAAMVTASIRHGSRRSSSSVFRASARSRCMARR